VGGRASSHGAGVEPKVEAEVEAKGTGEQGRESQQGLMSETLKTLNSLDERAEKIGLRLKQIEARMIELRKEEEEEVGMKNGDPPKGRVSPNQASGRGGRCRLGRVILMLGILGVILTGSEASAEGKKSVYDGLQGLLENVAMGIEEKQVEMREMDASLSAKRAELIEHEKTIRRRQKLLDLTNREVEDGILKLEEEKKAVEEKRAQAGQAEEQANCTAPMAEPERLTTKRGEVSGLQIHI
jgi:hypothetical protein